MNLKSISVLILSSLLTVACGGPKMEPALIEKVNDQGERESVYSVEVSRDENNTPLMVAYGDKELDLRDLSESERSKRLESFLKKAPQVEISGDLNSAAGSVQNVSAGGTFNLYPYWGYNGPSYNYYSQYYPNNYGYYGYYNPMGYYNYNYWGRNGLTRFQPHYTYCNGLGYNGYYVGPTGLAFYFYW